MLKLNDTKLLYLYIRSNFVSFNINNKHGLSQS